MMEVAMFLWIQLCSLMIQANTLIACSLLHIPHCGCCLIRLFSHSTATGNNTRSWPSRPLATTLSLLS